MFGLKMSELLIILLIVMVLFGASRLPQLGTSLGSAIKNFKKGFGGEEEKKEERTASLDNPQRLDNEKKPERDGEKS